VKKQPLVAIVGFPNVGKSTLFNRLLGLKKSLVHSEPGMTRDQVSSSCIIQDKSFVLVDTGGYFDFQEDPFSAQVKEKVWDASKQADFILFVCDAGRGLLPAEEELYFSLKKLNKPILIVVNKVDSVLTETAIGDFYNLGNENVIPVSAEHKLNLDELENAIALCLPESTHTEEVQSLKIAVVGRINVGKSSLINRLSGEDRLIVSEVPGTTRDSIDTLIKRDQKTFCLVDTAGIRKLSRTRDAREKASILKAKKDIRRADVICLVLDAQEFPTRQDTAIAHLAHDSDKPMIIALNKWDLVEKHEKAPEEFRSKVFHKLDFVGYAPLLLVSALSGKRVVKILDMSEKVYANAGRLIRTSRLNQFLEWVQANHPLLSSKKGKIKFKYMIQKGTKPPAFILFTHSRHVLSASHKKFLAKLISEKFDFSGTPVRLIIKRA